MTIAETKVAGRTKTTAAAVLVASLIVGLTAPSMAAASSADRDGARAGMHEHSSFHRHFWRGSQHRHAVAPRADMMALADEPEQIDEALRYCASRFRSYDPTTGTYLGYDGNEHSCP